MKLSILTLTAILGISQSYATGDKQAKDSLFDKKSSENKKLSRQNLRQSERGDPSEDRVLEHSKELRNKLEPYELPENFWEFEKLEEEKQKHTDKSHYDSSKEDRGDPLRGTWIDGENEENPLNQSGIWDRETGERTSQDASQILDTPEAAVSPPAAPAEKNIRDAGEWPVLPNPTEK